MTKSHSSVSPAARPAYAIVGFAGRFPGARDVETFWANLKGGVESRTVFTDDDLLAAGIPESMLNLPKLVRSGFVLDDVEMFDAAFFGFNPREAELLDPQHRLFLECAWQAMEHAGYDADALPVPVGIFGGATFSGYLSGNILRNAEVVKNVGQRSAIFGCVPDYMVPRVAYKLNLRGPAIFVQSACSTSLVAVHLACRSLAAGECDMALAGGVSVQVPHRAGYAYEDGSMVSPDGICRTFDSNARGTVFGNGVGLVVLKRLEDALAGGDTIHAVVRGSASNNDGSLKVGFTAPGVVGQSQVIELALESGDISAETISYVEAHGTGTELGDPIEIAALTRAYRTHTDKARFCAVGSVKPNIGHLDAAAGVSSLIKTVMALKHRQLPPTINFDKPNPKIDFEHSPFFVNTTLRDWDANGGPRRAGVSSFGFGGTNAHVIVEEAPEPIPGGPARAAQLFVVSARTETALNARTQDLGEFFQRRQCDSADAAFTLAVGRKAFAHRTAVVCAAGDSPADMLQGRDPRRMFTGCVAEKDRPVVLMFPGQGAQYVNMGRDLYRDEPRFRETVDACAERLHPILGADIRTVMYPDDPSDPTAADLLRQTSFTQSALFTIEYALAALWMSWGIKPAAMIGHSIGELVAACVAGVFTLDDALTLVATRGRVMEEMPTGTMAAVPLPGDQVARLLGGNLWLAALNGPSLSVVAGTAAAVDEFVETRAREGIECRRLHTSHAFHSGLMDAAVERFADAVRRVERRAPSMPFISNLTGTWITPEQAVDPDYWASHIRQPVRFAEGAATLLADGDRLLLECGPGNTLSALVRQQAGSGRAVVVSSLRHPQEQSADLTTILGALGRLWVAGAAVDWNGFYAGQHRRRVPLPTYPFERQRFWVEPEKFSRRKMALRLGLAQREDRSEWFHVVSWKHTMTPSPLAIAPVRDGRALLFEPAGVDCGALVERLQASGRTVLRVRAGERFSRVDDTTWTVAPDSRDDHATLVKAIAASGSFPDVVAHAWSIAAHARPAAADDASSAGAQKAGFYSLMHLAQGIGSAGITAPITIGVITDGVHEVIGNESLIAEHATVAGPVRVIPAEYPNVICRHLDLSIDEMASTASRTLDLVGIDLLTAQRDQVVAYRQGRRWVQGCEGARFEPIAAGQNPRLRKQGVYFLTGGYGGIGLVLAEHLAEHYEARLVLTGRRPFPPREEWAAIVERNPEDAAARRIRAVQKLEALGGEVMTGVADVTDEAATRAVVEQAVARFGRIDGVIHSAGVAGGGIIQMKKSDVAAAVLAPKVQGSRVLARVFADRKLDFMALCSSMTSLVGGFGQVDYCSANAYLDTFARAFAHETGTFTVAINWNAWREVGMAVDTSVPEDLRASLKGAMMSSGISNREGIDAFERILAHATEAQIAISPNDLSMLAIAMAIPEDEKVSAAAARPAAESGSASAAAAPKAASYHPRPPLPTPYVPPSNEVEKQICAIWQDSLGIDKVGVNDNFFELGGHSLLAISVMARVNQTLKSEIPVAKLYDGLTVAFLAAAIAPQAAQAEPEQDAEGDERRRDRARRQREQQARRRGMREMTRT